MERIGKAPENVITILEGEVLEANWDVLRQSFAERTEADKGIRPEQAFLIQDARNKTNWKLIAIWKDMATLMQMKATGEIPTGVLIFREAGTDPSLSIFQIQELLGK